jgi:hypothetical protein
MKFLLLYEFCMNFLLFFAFFSNFFALKLLIFGAPLATENKSTIFGTSYFRQLTPWPPKITCYFW